MSIPPVAATQVVVVGASAGGVEALRHLVGCLPGDLDCAVIVVLHVAASGTSMLAQILDRAGPLPVGTAADGDALAPGRVFVAPPDSHVLVERGRLRLSDEPRENGHRPAIDPTMRSAAAAYGAACCGVVLTGSRDDGTAGLAAIKAAGGSVLVQDPTEAMYPAMPRSAIAGVAVDAVLPVEGIARWLVRSAHAPAGTERGGPAPAPPGDAVPAGSGPTRFGCPDCGGVLWEDTELGFVQLHCALGHVCSPESLARAHGRELEQALWVALRALDDRSELMTRMAARATAAGRGSSAAQFTRRAQDAREHSELIRQSIDRFGDPSALDPGEAELA